MLTRQLLSSKQAALVIFAFIIAPPLILYLDDFLFKNCLSGLNSFIYGLFPWILILIPTAFIASFVMLIGSLFRKQEQGVSMCVFIGVCVLAFVGLIILVSSSATRSVGPSAVMQEELSGLRAAMELIDAPLPAASSCEMPPFTDNNTAPLLQSVKTLSGKITCYSENGAWAAAAPFPPSEQGVLCRAPIINEATQIQYCVDSTGRADRITGPLTGAKCPFSPPHNYTSSNPPPFPGGVYDVHTVDCVSQDVYDVWVKSGMRVEPGHPSIGVCPN